MMLALMPLAVVAIPYLIFVGISLAVAALTYVAGQLLKPKPKTPLIDQRPATQIDRGSFVPILIGRRRLGPVIGWVGDRSTGYAGHGGASGGMWGKGGGGGHGHNHTGQTTIFREKAWHILCVGPVAKLWRIFSNGAIIYDGPIDPGTFPSGSTVTLPNLGQFTIFWGDAAQNSTANALLGDLTRVGVTSVWSGICYIVWDLFLGQAPQWPIIEYELETMIQQTALAGPTGIDVNSNLPQIDGTIFGGVLPPAASNKGNVVLFKDPILGWGTYQSDGTTWTRLNTASPSYTGVNPGHAISQLLFAQFPYGAGADAALFDIPSLKALADTALAEGIAISTLIQDGDSALAIIATLLQDMGCMMTWDVQLGKWRFNVIREVNAGNTGNTLNQLTVNMACTIEAELLMEPLPEIETLHTQTTVDKVVFSYSDLNLAFRPVTVVIDEDGHASAIGTATASKTDLPNVIWQTSALALAERRSQEALAGGSKVTIYSNRETRLLAPGQAIQIHDLVGIFRITDVTFDADSGKTTITAISDFYGTPATAFIGVPAQGTSQPNQALPPLVADTFTIVELPEFILLAANGLPTIITPRIRGSSAETGTSIFLSVDNVSYTQEGTENHSQTGGTLFTAFPAGKFNQAQGPSFTALGPDIATVLDLSTDLAAWRAGKQLCVIDDEIFFLQKVTALGGSSYRLDGLLRARYDTVQESHAFGAKVFIFQDGGATDTTDSLIIGVGNQIWAKLDPTDGQRSLSLGSITPVTRTLAGKGIVPIAPDGLRITRADRLGASIFQESSNKFNACLVNGVGTLGTAVDMLFGWAWSTALAPGSGAGMQGAGNAAGVAPLPDHFDITIKTLANVVVATYQSTTNSFTYGAIQRGIDLEPLAISKTYAIPFIIEVRAAMNGIASTAATLTVTLI